MSINGKYMRWLVVCYSHRKKSYFFIWMKILVVHLDVLKDIDSKADDYLLEVKGIFFKSIVYCTDFNFRSMSKTCN